MSRSNDNGSRQPVLMGVALFGLAMGALSYWITSPSVDKDAAYQAQNKEETYGYKVTRFYERPSIFFPTGSAVYKTREWPNESMNRAWIGTRCRVYSMPLTQAGYEQCQGRVWESSRL